MRHIYLLNLIALLFICVQPVSGQRVDSANSHEYYLDVLKESEQQYYEEVVSDYNDFLNRNPDQVKVLVEKCQFIGMAMYDDYEEYNPNYEAHEKCLEELRENHSDNIHVRIFLAIDGYGDESVIDARNIIDDYENESGFPDDVPMANVYSKLAYNAFYDEDYGTAIDMAGNAMDLDTTIDLTYQLAFSLYYEDRFEEAKELIIEHTDTSNTEYEILRNAELLIDLKATDDAIRFLGWIDYENDEDEYQDYSAIAKILESANEINEARSYLLKSYNAAYSKSNTARALYKYDIKHQLTDSLHTSYSRMVEEGWYLDPMGIQRLKVLFHAPLSGWRIADLFGFFTGVLLLLGLFVVPYLWVLPIPFIGTLLSEKGLAVGNPNFDFGLRDFWKISFGYLVASLVAIVAFAPEMFSSYFNDTSYFYEETIIGEADARLILCFMILLGLWTFWISRKVGVKNLFHSQDGITKYLGSIIGFFLLVKLAAYFSTKVFGGLETLGTEDLSIADEIINLAEYYGFAVAFLFVAVIVPIYEEIIFRGIILSSVEKHMNYGLANVIQAVLFTLIHQDMRLFLFYFGVGLVGGMLVKRSNGLLIPILFHMLNNSLAMLVIYIRHV